MTLFISKNLFVSYLFCIFAADNELKRKEYGKDYIIEALPADVNLHSSVSGLIHFIYI